MSSKPVVVNLLGGPGAKKSSIAYMLAGKLKFNHINAELASEFAKSLTWAERYEELKIQPYVFGKQLILLERLRKKVDVIVTDSPLLLSAVYSGLEYGESFVKMVLSTFNSFNNKNYFINRPKTYLQVGRTQTREQAVQIDNKVKDFMHSNYILYKEFDGKMETVDLIIKDLGV